MCSCVSPTEQNLNEKEYITYTLEDIDSECMLYRISIKTDTPVYDWNKIDSKIRIKFNDVSIQKSEGDSLINLILKELPKEPEEIIIMFNR
jgi:hypothetical protein